MSVSQQMALAQESIDSSAPLPLYMKVYYSLGNDLNGTIMVGQQGVLFAKFPNTSDQKQHAVMFFQVRDSEDVTIFLAWQETDIPVGSFTDVGVLWTAPQEGQYEVLALPVTNLTNPWPLYNIGRMPVKVTINGAASNSTNDALNTAMEISHYNLFI